MVGGPDAPKRASKMRGSDAVVILILYHSYVTCPHENLSLREGNTGVSTLAEQYCGILYRMFSEGVRAMFAICDDLKVNLKTEQRELSLRVSPLHDRHCTVSSALRRRKYKVFHSTRDSTIGSVRTN